MKIIKIIVAIIVGTLFGAFLFTIAPFIFAANAIIDNQWPWEM